eukprot:2330375-Rhodomonas_salina.1
MLQAEQSQLGSLPPGAVLWRCGRPKPVKGGAGLNWGKPSNCWFNQHMSQRPCSVTLVIDPRNAAIDGDGECQRVGVGEEGAAASKASRQNLMCCFASSSRYGLRAPTSQNERGGGCCKASKRSLLAP